MTARKLNLHQNEIGYVSKLKNKTIADLAVQHAIEMNLIIEEISAINSIRMQKNLVCLFKLVRLNRDKKPMRL